MMEYRQLGGSGLRVPVLSFGTATFGGGNEFFKAWGATDVAGAKRLVDICRLLGARAFYEGAAGRDYIDESQFVAAGIRLDYQDYRHPVYPQLHGDFLPYLSVVDLLFNCGPASLGVLES